MNVSEKAELTSSSHHFEGFSKSGNSWKKKEEEKR